MPLVTLEELKRRTRRAADMENSGFISDEELTEFINGSAQELYDILVQADQDFETLLTTFSISSGNTYALPANFYKMRGIDVDRDGKWIPVRKFNLLERGQWTDVGHSYRRSNIRYQIVKDTLHFLPEENAVGNYRIWYVPEMTKLALDADTFNGRNGWDEYVVVDAAIKCLDKEESDSKALMARKKDLLGRVVNMSGERDYGEPETIVDMKRSRDAEEEWL